MHAWDLDESGNALISAQNRFEFFPGWTFDGNNDPVLEGSSGGRQQRAGVMEPTPPPRTPEQIERHMRLKRLDKHAFFDVDAVFEWGTASRYILKPLRYTPRYSVIYEIPGNTVIPPEPEAPRCFSLPARIPGGHAGNGSSRRIGHCLRPR